MPMPEKDNSRITPEEIEDDMQAVEVEIVSMREQGMNTYNLESVFNDLKQQAETQNAIQRHIQSD